MPTLTCPYCGAKANFSRQAEWTTELIGDGGALVMARHGAWTCDACHNPIVGARAEDQVNLAWYQPVAVEAPNYPGVPEEVASDAREAHRCLSVQAWRAAVVMARRALQSAAYDKGAPGGRLLDQIDWLDNQRIISPLMREVAHRIRLVGNLGAHPEQDGLRALDEPEAREVVEFLDDFLKYVYEIPSRLTLLGEEGPG